MQRFGPFECRFENFDHDNNETTPQMWKLKFHLSPKACLKDTTLEFNSNVLKNEETNTVMNEMKVTLDLPTEERPFKPMLNFPKVIGFCEYTSADIMKSVGFGQGSSIEVEVVSVSHANPKSNAKYAAIPKSVGISLQKYFNTLFSYNAYKWSFQLSRFSELKSLMDMSVDVEMNVKMSNCQAKVENTKVNFRISP